MIYLYIGLFLGLCSVFGRRNLFLYCVVYTLLLFVAGFRDISVGTDTENYYTLFQLIKTDSLYDWMQVEFGWKYLNLLIIKMGGGYEMVVFCTSFLTLTSVFITVWKFSNRPFFSILFFYLLFFYFNSFNVSRQMLAVAFVFAAYHAYMAGYKKWNYILVGIAMLFHISAVLGLLIPVVIKYFHISPLQISLLLGVTYVLGIVMIPRLLPLFLTGGKYDIYLEEDASAAFSLPRLLINCLCISIIMLTNRRYVELRLFVVGVLCYNLLSFSEVAGRCAYYFMMSQLILYANRESYYRWNKHFIDIVVVLYGIVYLSMLLSNNNAEVLPYKNIFFM